jgi:hypothetical protein
MKTFLDELINKPLDRLKKEMERIIAAPYEEFPEEHNGNFTIITDIVRRCHFLNSTEKEVLYELFSWASTTKAHSDGYCKVTESHIRVNTGLGLSTVKKAISTLNKKKFISKALDFDNRNLYRINSAYKNPYIILSELVFFIRRRTIEQFSYDLVDESDINYLLGKKLFIESTMDFVKSEKLYLKYINKLKSIIDIFDSLDVVAKIADVQDFHTLVQDVKSEIDIIYQEKVNALYK